ncbi:cd7 antigen-like [Morone saxatilis]|uniref:cd7 antigen-like n=1 Tax=Morone saxatilis TaxID=34816 RepID=UPI0015E1C9BD|nr:cd7 antigen-like [Morone saxatilis]
MTEIQYLAYLWTLVIITQTGCVCSDIQFLERHEGESVVLPCVVDQKNPSPFAVYLKRSWLQPGEVLFMHTKDECHVTNNDDKSRTSTSGDPSRHSLNVTISQLRASDTDRYYCEFYVDDHLGEDKPLPERTEFFLLVNADTPGSVDIGLVETCAGGSAVLPCFPPNGEGSAVEGVSLKRQKGRAPVEVLYHSKHHHGRSPASSSSKFPGEKFQLSTVPGPGGITYNLTLQQLQPDDSALYSCQLLLQGRSGSSTSLGRKQFFVSVQGAQCGCPSYSTLLYALSSAVAILIFLLGFVLIYQGKSRRRVKSQPQAPIYEDMAGVQLASQKLASRHLQEMEPSEYRNCPVKKSCPENYYESPTGALHPRKESQN